MTEMLSLGFAGLGLMGQPMVRRLLAAGFTVQVWNRHPEKAAALLALGATWAETPQALAEQCDVVMLCLADTAAVEHVVFGEHGLIHAQLAQARFLVDFSSITPDATRRFAAQVAEQQPFQWIDAPVSGGVVGAEQGSLVIMAGGDADAITGLTPVFSALSSRVTRMGDVGSGQVSKLCNQLIVAANAVLIAEAVALAEQAGVDPHLLAPALAGGFADSKPFQLLTPRMAQGQYEPVQWKVATLLKDLHNALDSAQQAGLTLPVASQAAAQLAHHAEGFGVQDLSTLIELYRKAR